MNEAVAGSRSPSVSGLASRPRLSYVVSYCEASAAVGGVRAARIAG